MAKEASVGDSRQSVLRSSETLWCVGDLCIGLTHCCSINSLLSRYANYSVPSTVIDKRPERLDEEVRRHRRVS